MLREKENFWHIQKQGRTVNASCVDNNVIAAASAVSPACFSGCPQPTNQTSVRAWFQLEITHKETHTPPCKIFTVCVWRILQGRLRTLSARQCVCMAHLTGRNMPLSACHLRV